MNNLIYQFELKTKTNSNKNNEDNNNIMESINATLNKYIIPSKKN